MVHETQYSTKGKRKLDTIIEEYISKHNLFDPRKPSPNKFITKLEYRMKSYYNDIYKTLILNKK